MTSINAETTDLKTEFLVYPNSSTGRFHISFGNWLVQQAAINIFNIQCKLMRIETFENTYEVSFDIGSFPKGIYIIRGNLDSKDIYAKVCLE